MLGYLFQNGFVHENDTDDYKVLRLPSLSATRWTTRVKAADVIFDKTLELRKPLEILQNDENVPAETKSRIQRILKKQFSSL